MQCGRDGDLRGVGSTARGAGDPSALHRFTGLFDLQRIDELIEESWDPVVEFDGAAARGSPLGYLEAAAVDEIRSVGDEKFE